MSMRPLGNGARWQHQQPIKGAAAGQQYTDDKRINYLVMWPAKAFMLLAREMANEKRAKSAINENARPLSSGEGAVFVKMKRKRAENKIPQEECMVQAFRVISSIP